MKQIISAEIEEFETGAWVATVVSMQPFDGSFTIGGITWTGTAVTTRDEFERYHTTVVGGKHGLATLLPDKFYSGSVTLQAAVNDICRECGETFGSVTPGVFMPAFERLRGPAYQGLEALARSLSSVWWIGRDGALNMKAARDTGGTAKGQAVSGLSDSVLLVNPEALTIGATFEGDLVRHIRWLYTADRFAAEVYFLPFVFRAPTDTRYSALDTARVDRDRGDGTIDVIVAGRYGLTQVPFYIGVPGSKAKVNQGELVQVGYFGGDPQKPYAVSMAQSITAVKQVARNGDTVKVTILPGTLTLAVSGASATGPSAPLEVTGTITSGSDRLKVGD